MQKRRHIPWVVLLGVFLLNCNTVNAEVLPLDDALRATYTACVGIDESLSDLKKMAGINTAVTGVGTALGAGATVVGIVKASKDAQAEELEKLIKELHELEDDKPEPTDAELKSFMKEFETSYDFAIKDISTTQDKLDDLNKKSKSLGNWRTGLMAGNTATNIAGAIIAGNNKVDDDLQTQIDKCKLAVKNLRDSINQARFNGQDISEATQIADACREYDYIDISPINKRGKDPHDVADILGRSGVCIRAGHHCAQPLMDHLGVKSTCRASFAFYNTEEEVDRFLAELSKVRGLLGYGL